jgi:hypothetical protein
MTPENSPLGATVLRVPAIQSPNFVTGVSGWAIFANGTAEFNSLDINPGGVFTGTDYIINENGAFFYNGAPALNTLVLSIVPGTALLHNPPTVIGFAQDAYGNWYFPGCTVYSPAPGGATFEALSLQSTAFPLVGPTGNQLTEFVTPGATMGGVTSPWTLGATAGILEGTIQLNGPVDFAGTTSVSALGVATVSQLLIYGTSGSASIEGTTQHNTGATVIDGLLTGSSATLSGTLTAVNATLSGTLTAVNATLSGSVNITGATGTLTAQGGSAAFPTLVTTDTWNPVSFVNSWANMSASNMPLRYRMNCDQTVSLKGIIKSGTAATVCTLPAAYRNAAYAAFAPLTTTSGVAGFVQVSTAGVVTVNTYSAGLAWIIDITYPLT